MTKYRTAILGTVGVPGNYGGFETLAENLVRYHFTTARQSALTVYCSTKAYENRTITHGGARLRYVNLDANGPESIAYDTVCLVDAVRSGHNRLLLLGVSGALALPFLRLVSRSRIVTNIDGIEWKRGKWKGLAKIILRALEWFAVRFSHTVIADNEAIADYITETYRTHCEVIPYGGDHVLEAEPDLTAVADLPKRYALALCRIEPENSVSMILEAFAQLDTPLVFVGNWDKSTYGRELKARYQNHPSITIHGPVYESRARRAIGDRASMYIHGHSAGGTNPSLVEMMHFGIPVLAHGCSFNRHTTEGKACYFMAVGELIKAVRALTTADAVRIGTEMSKIARQRYTWNQVGKAYFDLLES